MELQAISETPDKSSLNRFAIGIICFSIVILAGLWMSVEVLVARERGEKINEVMKENANLARSFEEHTIRTLGHIDENLLILKRRFEAQGERFDLAGFWADMQINPAIARNAAITDETEIGRAHV